MGRHEIIYAILGYRRKVYDILFFLLTYVNKITNHRNDKILIFDPKYDKFDNTGALYDYLISEKYNEKYVIVNVCKDYKRLRNDSPKNVIQCGNLCGVIHFLTSTYVYYRSMTIRIKPAQGQHVIQMWHGSPCKGGELSQCRTGWINPYYTGFLSASVHFDPVFSKVFSLPEEKMIRCGHPRTDVLFKTWSKYDFGTYKKLVIWTPTYRKYKKTRWGMGAQVENEEKLLPLIPVKEFEEVNKYLKNMGVKIVVKLHPMQSLEQYHIISMENFILMSDDDFKAKGLDLYKLMTQCDAMITDYSSIYWDFLVLDRPIGFTEDDVEDYGKGRGFIMDDPEKYKPGAKLVTMDDFYKFVNDLAYDIDEYKQNRKEMNQYGNPVTDGYSSKRALECVGITI